MNISARMVVVPTAVKILFLAHCRRRFVNCEESCGSARVIDRAGNCVWEPFIPQFPERFLPHPLSLPLIVAQMHNPTHSPILNNTHWSGLLFHVTNSSVLLFIHMGQFLQDEENGRFVTFLSDPGKAGVRPLSVPFLLRTSGNLTVKLARLAGSRETERDSIFS